MLANIGEPQDLSREETKDFLIDNSWKWFFYSKFYYYICSILTNKLKYYGKRTNW